MKYLLLILAGLHISASTGRSQNEFRIDEWRVESSKLIVRDMGTFGDYVYAATGGGLISYVVSGTKTITILDGLSSVDITSLTIDSRGTVILGMDSPSGNIDFYSSENGSIYTINENLSEITALEISGDSVFAGFIAADQVGLLLIEYDPDSERYHFKDSFMNFPDGVSFQKITAISVIGDSVYVGTDNGLLSASLKNENLKDPLSWVAHNMGTGDERHINAIGSIGDTLLAAPDNLVFRREDSVWVVDGEISPSFLTSFSFFNLDSETYMATDVGVYIRSPGGGWSVFSGERRAARAITASSKGDLWIGFFEEGPAEYDRTSARFVTQALNSPFNNILTSVSISSDSVLWVGSNKGHSRYSNGRWKSYLSTPGTTKLHGDNVDWLRYVADTLSIPRSTVEVVFAASNGLVYFGYGGKGMLEFNPSSPEDYVLYNTVDGILAGSEGHGGNSEFVVVDDITEDNSGNIWVANAFAETNRHLAVIDTLKNWHYFDSDSGLMNGVLRAVSLDSRGNVWLGFQADSEILLPEGGVQVIDYSGSLGDQSDDIMARITKKDGLESNIIQDIAVDRDDVVWIAVVGGVHRLVIPEELTDSGLRNQLSVILPVISDHTVNRIEVDSRNNKWFATEAGGVKVLLNDNTWLNGNDGFTLKNSDILSNNVTSIEFDPRTGDVFIATLKGLSILRSEYRAPLLTLDEVRTYPSPFIIPADRELVIDNLADGAGVKILDINGDLIRNLSGSGEIRGSQAFWDGRDDDGRLVSSGIYIAFVYTASELSASAKIAVIKR